MAYETLMRRRSPGADRPQPLRTRQPTTRAGSTVTPLVGLRLGRGTGRNGWPAAAVGERLLRQDPAATAPASTTTTAGGSPSATNEGDSLAAFPTCTQTPPMPGAEPPPLIPWFGDPTLARIRAEEPGDNRILLSAARGSRGPAVQLVQQAMLAWGCETHDRNLLPGFGADGLFGKETDRATRTVQAMAGIAPDGLVGPITLARLDEFVLRGRITRQQPPSGGPPGPVKATAQAEPVSVDSTLADRITAISMNEKGTPSVVRKAQQGSLASFANITLDKPMEFEGKVTFKAGTSQGSLQFGFFQLGRPFEVYEAVYTRADPHPKPNLSVNETNAMRAELPAQDHDTPLFSGSSHTVGGGALSVTEKFSDPPKTPFQTIRPSNGVNYRLSGVRIASFFFTGFGLLKGGRALLLSTRYWTMRYCEEIPAATDLSKDGTKKEPVHLTPARDGRTHGLDLGEPGARKAGNNAPGWGNSADPAKTYVHVANVIAASAIAKGPDKFDFSCG